MRRSTICTLDMTIAQIMSLQGIRPGSFYKVEYEPFDGDWWMITFYIGQKPEETMVAPKMSARPRPLGMENMDD